MMQRSSELKSTLDKKTKKRWRNLRANYCQYEGAPGQIAAVILASSLPIASRSPVVVSSVVAMTWTSVASMWACQHRDSDECADEEEVEKYPEPTEYSGTTTSEEQRQEHRDKSVQHGSCKNTFDSAVSVIHAMSSFDCVHETVYFDHALRENAERDNG